MQQTPLPRPPEPSPDLMSQGLQLLERCFSARGAQNLVGLGLFCALFSAVPLLQSLGSSGLALVMLLYSLGLWGGGLQLRHAFPWVGRVLLGLGLAALPLNYLALASLDLGPVANVIFCLLALGLLPGMAWDCLRRLQAGRADPLYLLVLVALGTSGCFLPGLASALMARGLSPQAFALGELGLGALLAGSGLWRICRQLWLLDGHDNLGESLWLSALLLFAWLAGVSLFSLPADVQVLAPLLPAIGLLAIGARLRRVGALLLDGQARGWLRHWPVSWRWALTGCEGLGGALVCLTALAGCRQPGPGAIGLPLLAGLTLLYLAAGWPRRWLRWPLFGAGLLGLGPLVFQSGGLSADAASLLLGLGAWLLTGLLRVPVMPARGGQATWRLGCQLQALLLIGCSWWQIGRFADWSAFTLDALICLTLAAAGLARYSGFSAVGYLSVATGMTAVFCAVVLVEPLLSLESWRWFALMLAFVMLGCGWLIERLSPGGKPRIGRTAARGLSSGLGRLLGRTLPDPYRFRERFVSSLPYLFAEPLYNLALLLLTGAWLTDLHDLSYGAAAALFYGLVFAIYPSRLWIYLVLLSLSDGLIGLSETMLPARYHSWSLVLISLGWFFAGTLIEELLEARDRHKPQPEHELQKKWVRPFFHAALAANLLMLQRIFGQVQLAAGSESWSAAAGQALPMLLTSGLYLLKLRIYVSKLWFYPGMLTVTLGLYFSLGAVLPLEGHLLLLSLVAWVWAGVGRLWRHHPALQAWWQDLIVFRLGDKPLTPRFISTHLQRPESPFFTVALLAGLVSLGFSWLLIPAQLLQWEQLVELSFLTKARPFWLDLFQLLNLGLLAGLFALALPASGRQRTGLNMLVILSASSGLLWLGRWQLNADTLALALVALALLWQLLGLAARLPEAFRRCLEPSVALLGLGGLLTLPLGTRLDLDVQGLALLAILCLTLLQQRARVWHAYALMLCWMGVVGAAFWSGWLNSVAVLGLCLAAAGYVFTGLDRRLLLARLEPHLQGLALGHLGSALLCLGALPWAGPDALTHPLVLPLALACLGLLGWQSVTLPVLGLALAPASLAVAGLALVIQPWLAPLAFAGLIPLLAWTIPFGDKGGHQGGARISALAAPVLLQLPVLLAPPAGVDAGWQSGHLLAGSGIYLWLLCRSRFSSCLPWWGVAGLANLAWEWGFWQGWALPQVQSGRADALSLAVQVHASLLLPGLTMLLLAQYLLRRQPEKDQLTYFGLSLLLLMPLSLLAIRGAGLPKPLLLAELLAQVVLLLVLASRWRRRALLYTGLTVGLCIAVGLFGGLLLHGSAWLRWLLCLGLGLLLAGGGLFVQQRLDWLHWLISHWRRTLLSWK
ncbi:MAG: hypothetical protein ACAI44_38485 [Candidatus Sericytochromatia bacterium]